MLRRVSLVLRHLGSYLSAVHRPLTRQINTLLPRRNTHRVPRFFPCPLHQGRAVHRRARDQRHLHRQTQTPCRSPRQEPRSRRVRLPRSRCSTGWESRWSWSLAPPPQRSRPASGARSRPSRERREGGATAGGSLARGLPEEQEAGSCVQCGTSSRQWVTNPSQCGSKAASAAFFCNEAEILPPRGQCDAP